MALGKATVNILANLKPLQRGLATARVAVKKMVSVAGSALKTGFKAGFRAVTSGLRRIANLAKMAAIAILGIGIASIKVASDVQETENLFKISMGNMAEAAGVWVKEYSRSLGLFESDTKKALGTFQLMLTSMGIAEDKAFDMSKGMTQLVNDISSFRNLRPDEVFNKLTGAITGETEGLKRIGILVNDNIIQRMALTDAAVQERLALEKTTPVMKKYGNLWVDVSKKTKKQTLALTDAEKVMLRYKTIINSTTRDQGDMQRTLDDTANVFRAVWSQVKVTANTIGQVFLPAVTKAGIAIRDFFINNQPMIQKWAKVVNDAVVSAVNVLQGFFDLAKSGDFEGLGKAIGEQLNKIGEGLKVFFAIFTPLAVEVGRQVGKGFWSSIKDTKLGKFLTTTGQITSALAQTTRAVTPLGQAVGGATAIITGTGPRERSVAATIALSKATLEVSRRTLEELKRQTQLVAEGAREIF